MKEIIRRRDSHDLSWPHPWQGEIELPPGGVNHAYRPITRRKKDGSPGIGFAKTKGYDEWAQAQVWLLRGQGIPRLVAGTPLTIILRQRLRNARADVDYIAKAILDVLAAAVCPPEGDPWNDRDCHLLVLSKTLDKAHPGVTVTLILFEEQAPERAYGLLLSMGMLPYEGLP